MLEAVVLGVAGVLVSRRDLDLSRIEAAAEMLSRLGLPAERFRSAAHRRMRKHGRSAVISRTVKDLQLPLQSHERRWLELRARVVPPRPPDTGTLREGLSRLRKRYQLVLLDDCEPQLLDAWLHSWELAELPHFCLWSGNLGHQAHFPSPLAFRWLARRLDLRARGCLFVAGSDVSQRGAQKARWSTWSAEELSAGSLVDLNELASKLDA